MTTEDKEEIAMAECGSCRAVIPLDSSECPECGISFSGVSEESLGECGACNSLVPIDSKSCPECGVFFVADDVLDVLRTWFTENGVDPQKLFTRFDADNDGSIDAEELRQGLLKMNLADLPPSQVERVINEVDTDSDGVISLAELVMAITGEELSVMSEETTMDKIEFSDNVMSRIVKNYEIIDREDFIKFAERFDTNENNYLTEAELKQAAEEYTASATAVSETDNDLSDSETTDDLLVESSKSDSNDDVDDANEELDDSETDSDDEATEENTQQEAEAEDSDDIVENEINDTTQIISILVSAIKEQDLTIREVFESMDLDDNGHIDGPELQRGITDICGESLSPNEIFQLLNELDENENGQLDAMELVSVIESHDSSIDSDRSTEEDPMAKLLSAIDESGSNVGSVFRSLDSNNDGLLSLEEMRSKLHEVLGESFTDEEINELTNHFDDDGDGNVDLFEFIQTLEEQEDIQHDESASLSEKKEFPSKLQKRMMSKQWNDVVWPLIHAGWFIFVVLWVVNATLAPFVDGSGGMVELDTEFGQTVGEDGTQYINGDIYPCDEAVQKEGCNNSLTPFAGSEGEISMPVGFYWDGILFIIIGIFGLIGGLFMQYSVVSSWRARAKAMKEDSNDRKEVKEAIADDEKSSEEATVDEEDSDINKEDSEKVIDEEEDEEDDEEYDDDEIDVGSHIGLLLDDEEVFGVIIEFDDDEGLVTIEEDGTGDLVTGYQDEMFIDD